MRTLDQLLSESATRAFETKIQDLVNVEKWTKGNRDQIVEDLDVLVKKVSEEAFFFTQGVLDREIDGVPLLTQVVYRELLSTLIAFLRGLREDLDTLVESDGSTPDYTWINNVIREKIAAFIALDETVDRHMNLNDLEGVESI